MEDLIVTEFSLRFMSEKVSSGNEFSILLMMFLKTKLSRLTAKLTLRG